MAYNITNTPQLRFTKMLCTLFPAGTRGCHGELIDACLYHAYFNGAGAVNGWGRRASPRLDQFFDMADFFAGENQ